MSEYQGFASKSCLADRKMTKEKAISAIIWEDFWIQFNEKIGNKETHREITGDHNHDASDNND